MTDPEQPELLSTIANKPSLNPEALKIKGDNVANATIEVLPDKDPIKVDLTKTLLFTMLPTLSSGSGGSDNSMMTTMMMVLLLDKDKDKSSSDNTLLLMLPLLMMSNKK